MGLAETIAASLEGGALTGIVSAYLFGSEAEGRAHRESDVDVGVVLQYDQHPTMRDRFETRLRLCAELGVALGREVDVIVLNDAPPLLARRVVLFGHRVFCRDRERDHSFVRDVQLRAADLEPFLRRARRTKLSALRQ
jgi:predicted nucleotidyltransferase